MARPRAEDYHEKQRLILNQAAKLFAQKGFAGTSIATIAEYCNSSKALIYHYYPSKETMLFDMLKSHCELLLSSAEQVVESEEDAPTRLRSLLSSFMHVYAESNAKHAVMLNDLHWLPEAQQSEIKTLERRVVDVFRNLVGELRPDLDEKTRNATAMALMGSINWTYIWFKQSGSLSAEDYARLTSTLFFNGLDAVTGLDKKPISLTVTPAVQAS